MALGSKLPCADADPPYGILDVGAGELRRGERKVGRSGKRRNLDALPERDNITGSLTISRAECGSVTWQVDGRMSDGVVTLIATVPSPSTDKCGVAPAASITATRTPYCNTTGQGKVEPRK